MGEETETQRNSEHSPPSSSYPLQINPSVFISLRYPFSIKMSPRYPENGTNSYYYHSTLSNKVGVYTDSIVSLKKYADEELK